MKELINSLQSATWWVSVVVVGLAVNVIAAYLKPALDRIWGRISEAHRAKAAQDQHETELEVDRLMEDRQLVIEAKLDLINNALMMIVSLGATFAFLVLLIPIFFAPGRPALFTIICVVLFAIGGFRLFLMDVRVIRQLIAQDKVISLYRRKKSLRK